MLPLATAHPLWGALVFVAIAVTMFGILPMIFLAKGDDQ